MQYVDVTLGRVSNVDPVPKGASVCVQRCTLSILVSLPIWISLVGSIVPGALEVYMIVPSFDATADITTLPIFGVAEFGDGCETFSS